MRVANLSDTAEMSKRRPAGLCWREPVPKEFVSGLVKMGGNLFLQIAIELIRLPKSKQSRQKYASLPHDRSSCIFKKRATIPDACSHAAASTCNCFRPRLVKA